MSKPTTEVLAFQATRVANQAGAPLRKLTAIELLGRAPTPITIPEFEGAVFYFAHPSAKQVIKFFESRSRIIKEIQESEGAASAQGGDESVLVSVGQVTPEQTEAMRMASCELLAMMLVNEDGSPMFTLDQVAEEMSREMFMLLTREMATFLSETMGAGVKKAQEASEEKAKTDEDIRTDLITLQDDLDADNRKEALAEDTAKNA